MTSDKIIHANAYTSGAISVSTIPEPQIDKDEYISAICVRGKTYKLRCEVVEIYPITCPKCGASFELRYGSGKCDHCGTNYTTQFKLREV